MLYNGHGTTPSKEVKLGAEITVPRGNIKCTVVVTGLSAQRKQAKYAETLYEETDQSRKIALQEAQIT